MTIGLEQAYLTKFNKVTVYINKRRKMKKFAFYIFYVEMRRFGNYILAEYGQVVGKVMQRNIQLIAVRSDR